MVVGGRARHDPATGPPQSRQGSPDERARPGRGQLALALYRGDAVGSGVRVAATADDGIAPRRGLCAHLSADVTMPRAGLRFPPAHGRVAGLLIPHPGQRRAPGSSTRATAPGLPPVPEVAPP